MLVLLGSLIVLTQGSAVAPFILHVVLVSDVGIGTEISVPIVNEDSLC